MYYKIITATSIEDLQTQVGAALKAGWTCQGGVQRCASTAAVWFLQAVSTNDKKLT